MPDKVNVPDVLMVQLLERVPAAPVHVPEPPMNRISALPERLPVVVRPRVCHAKKPPLITQSSEITVVPLIVTSAAIVTVCDPLIVAEAAVIANAPEKMVLVVFVRARDEDVVKPPVAIVLVNVVVPPISNGHGNVLLFVVHVPAAICLKSAEPAIVTTVPIKIEPETDNCWFIVNVFVYPLPMVSEAQARAEALVVQALLPLASKVTVSELVGTVAPGAPPDVAAQLAAVPQFASVVPSQNRDAISV